MLTARSASEIAIRRPGQASDRFVDFASNMGDIAGLSADGKLMPVEYAGVGSGADYLSYVANTDTADQKRHRIPSERA
ncbi:MAG TPA: hypothetical protein VFC15_09000 [Candidatus Limnocylindrales bacterium]|jgi:hypothetical protein|nr:hypothetical protein [Candidatus Limnocylindrales bacterium]HZM10332.1 hypothetical protein [Candidatus Limnocylindrales bacterium]